MFRNVTRLARAIVCCAIVLGCTSFASAALRLPVIFSDNMVLQRGQTIPVWGWAAPNDQVTVTLAGQTATATADASGYWRVQFTSLEVGDPLEMVVKDASGEVLLFKNILVGEVWVCSGQSNMQWAVRGVKDADQEIAAADYPKIRLFSVSNTKAPWQQKDALSDGWTSCTPQSATWFSAVAYFFGRNLHKELNVPVGLINTSWGGTPAEYWISRPALEADPVLKDFAKNGDAACLYNAMIAPLMPYAFRGAIWYQGESNVGGAYLYRTLFPAMISNWRKAWNQGDFPFGFVQIAPFSGYGEDPAKGSAAAELREAQRMTLSKLPNTGMAVITDLIDDLANIHPTNKQDVGHRLALWALATVYGRDLVYSGPSYKSMAVEGGRIRLQFDHVGGGLAASDNKPLGEFTIAGEDQKFVPAAAEIDGNTVVVHSDQVASPVAVRFSWRTAPTPSLMNKEGLPASPFRTDDWKGVTQP